MMKETHAATPTTPFGAMSEMWMSAWLQPWSAWQTWTEFWTGPWKGWLNGMASAPAAWLPALAAERKGEPPAIDFFLPWLPRVEAVVRPLEGSAGEEALRVMLRAALPPLGHLSAAEWLTVDALVKTGAKDDDKPAPVLEASPAAEAIEAPPARRAPAKRIARTASKAAAGEASAVEAGAGTPAVAAEPAAPAATAGSEGPAAAKAEAAKPARTRAPRKPKAGGKTSS